MKSETRCKLDDSGKIVLAENIRKQANISLGDVCDISVGGCGKIIIQKHTELQDISGELDRIKNAMLSDEVYEEIREKVFIHVMDIERLIKSVRE